MKHSLLLLTLLLSAVLMSPAQRQRTTMDVKPSRAMSSSVSRHPVHPGWDEDTLVASAGGLHGIIELSGYDKPVSASRETMHVTNLTDSLTVTGFSFEIVYLDRKDRELHRRAVTVNDHVGPRLTVMTSFPSWDIQRSFYYILSVKPRRQATPYDIRCNIKQIFIKKESYD